MTDNENMALTADFQACRNVDYMKRLHSRMLEIEKFVEIIR